MSDSSLNLAINLSAVDAASTVIHGVGDAIKNLASGNVMGAAVDIGKALLNVGASSVKMAGDYQAGMTSLVTGAGEAQSNIKLVSDGILQMAVDTGTSTKQLTDGMYMIESAGYHGADGLNVLKIAAEGAKVGNADLGVTANALTTMLHDYGMSSTQASGAMNALITTVASGKTHLQDLAGSMGSILPLASSLGVAFPQIGGALATMTNAGMSAQQAAQNVAAALRALSNPSAGATKMLKTMGLTAQQLKDELSTQGLTGALQMVEDHVGKKFPAGSVEATHAFSVLLGGATGVKVALMLGGENMKTFEANVKSVSGAMKSGSSDVTGWALVQQDLNFQMARFHEIGEAAMIKLGQALLPMVTGAFELLNNAMQGAGNIMKYVGEVLHSLNLSDFNDAWTDVKQSVVELGQAFQVLASRLMPIATDFDPIANAIAGLARGGLQILTTILWQVYVAISAVSTAIMGSDRPISDIGAAFKQVGAILGGQFKADLAWLGNTFNQIAGWVKTSLMPALATLVPPFESIATTIITNFLPAFAQVYASMQQLGQAILTPLIGVLENIIPPVIRLAGLLADGLAAGFKVIGPLVKGLADTISVLIDFFTKTEIGCDLVKAALILLTIPVGYLALAFTGLAVIAIADFIAAVPAMVAGFIAGAAGAWTMASGVIALTWPILAVIAVIALIILAIQHWGDIMDWMSGKTEQTRIKVEQEHVKMRIAQDDNTAKGAQAAINNMEKERLGIIQKLKETNDESEKLALTHQYNMIASQEQAQKAKLQKADENKKQQLAKQKELQDEMLEAQKPWYQRMWDAIANFFGKIGQWFTDRFTEARNGITKAFAPVGDWFHEKWNEVQKWWGGVGQWFNDKWKEASTAVVSTLNEMGKGIQDAANTAGKWITDKWNEIGKGIQDAVNTAGKWITDKWNEIVNDLIGRFEWLYNHNYYFKQLVDNIVLTFKFCIAWIETAWNASVNWLVGVWNTVAKFATDIWNKVSGAVTGAIKIAWDWLVSAWNAASKWLQDAWNTVAKFATDIWNKVSDAVTGAVKTATSWLQSEWNKASSWLQSEWNKAAKFTTDLWNKIATNVHDNWVKAVDYVTSVWNQVSAIFTGAWNNYVVKPLTAFWNYVSNVFSSAWSTYISPHLNSLWNFISTWFTNLGKGAQTSGQNFITMLVNGINSGTGAIWNAVVGIANTIWKALGFHSPAKEGPGSDADKWMPNLVSMLSDGINSNAAKVQSASNNIAAGINNALGKLGPNARTWSSDMMNNFVNGILAAVNATGNAVAQIANKISAFLHFSKPDVGPLSNSDTWMTDFGNMLTSGITNNVSKVQTAAANLASSMSSALSNTGTNAMNSATNFINMLVNGINSGVGSIWNAVVNIANTIWKALGFHSPAKAGPGADADKWMPNLTSMLSSSLTAGVPKMQAAVDALTKPLAALSPTGSNLGTNVDKWTSDLISKISNDLTAGVSKIQAAVNAMAQPLASLSNGSAAPAAAAPQSTANTNNTATTIHVHLDGNSSADAQKRGRDIAEVVKKELAKTLRQQSIAPRYTSGGTHN